RKRVPDSAAHPCYRPETLLDRVEKAEPRARNCRRFLEIHNQQVKMALSHLTPLSPFTTLARRLPPFPALSSATSRRHNRISFSVMASAVRKVLVPIANGTEPMEAVITVDVLRRAGADVTVASVENQLRVDACHGVKIVADALITDCVDTVFDLISLPAVGTLTNNHFFLQFAVMLGGMPGASTLKDNKTLENIVKKQASEGRLYAAICAAPAVALGSWGLLKGLKATCYPSFMEQLASSATTVESRVQQDGKAVTSRGPGTAMEYSVALVEQLFGKEKADEVSGPLVRSSFSCLSLFILMPSKHTDQFIVAELNKLQWTSSSEPKILVPIADGSEEMEAVMIIDVLRRAKAEVVVASVGDKLETVASRKVKLVADMLLDEAAKLSYDLIVLPGGLGGAQAFASSETLVNLLKKQSESDRYYGAICASPALVLEPHGLLKVFIFTTFYHIFIPLHPSEAESRVVIDGKLITSRGPGTSLEFSLAIVEKLLGREKALELAKTMLVM
ncbi:DJ-1-like protein, partial [Cynara cardunculus var. scolymus]